MPFAFSAPSRTMALNPSGSRIAGEVVALEQDAALATNARAALAPISRVPVVSAPLTEGWPQAAPYDVILLEGATEVLFSDAGLTGSIDRYEDLGADIRERQPGETGAVIQDKARKGRLAITVTAAGAVPVGRHGFRVRTPLGGVAVEAVVVQHVVLARLGVDRHGGEHLVGDEALRVLPRCDGQVAEHRVDGDRACHDLLSLFLYAWT